MWLRGNISTGAESTYSALHVPCIQHFLTGSHGQHLPCLHVKRRLLVSAPQTDRPAMYVCMQPCAVGNKQPVNMGHAGKACRRCATAVLCDSRHSSMHNGLTLDLPQLWDLQDGCSGQKISGLVWWYDCHARRLMKRASKTCSQFAGCNPKGHRQGQFLEHCCLDIAGCLQHGHHCH